MQIAGEGRGGIEGAAPWVLAALLSSCAPPRAEPRVLRLAQVRPESASGVYLNERLVLHFSEELEPSSVHPLSVHLAADDGKVDALGEWEVEGRTLVFAPRPVLASDLRDGGYLPSTGYVLEIAGFPRPDGVRARSGAPLERGIRWRFRTVEVSRGGERRGFVFEDSSLGVAHPLVLVPTELEPTGAILFEGEEPIDPSSLTVQGFLLRGRRTEGGAPIPLRMRLLENHDKHALPQRGRTKLALQHNTRLEPGEYWLEVDLARTTLVDFGGNHVPVVLGEVGARMHRIAVVEETGLHVEEFDSPDLRSLEPVEEADGTAAWGRSGKLEILLPAAAGSGRDENVQLAGLERRRDIHATCLRLEKGLECTLDGGAGTVVLRSQGMLRLDGRLVREIQRPGLEWVEEAALLELGAVPAAKPESFSAWLGSIQAQDLPVTVLVAGGDLVLSGEIRCSGALVLVAGGSIRLRGLDLPVADRMYTLVGAAWWPADQSVAVNYFRPGESRSPSFAVDLANPQLGNPQARSFLSLDVAQENLLQLPLTFSVLSGPIPRLGRAARWHKSPKIEAHAGNGSFRVRYFADLEGGSEGPLVDDPALLDDAPALRMRFDLKVEPGPVWDPPWIDRLELRWDPAGIREGR